MDDILQQNEKEANKIVARILRITWLLFTVTYVLHRLKIFQFNSLDETRILITYIIGSAALLLPSVFVKLIKDKINGLKYFNILCATIFIASISTMLTYHVAVLYTYVISVASLYFSKSTNIFATVLTIMITSGSQLYSFFMNPSQDLNFKTLKDMILFGILPKEVTLVVIAAIFVMLTDRTAGMLTKLSTAVKDINTYQHEMITGFATLIEQRDGDTGEHIRRTSLYVELIARELVERGFYQERLTESYINNLLLAAPLHDIGKVSVPDNILQKPGRLTDEEYEIMKLHAPNGGKIIKETFGHIKNAEFFELAYEVANYHHERWNGRGYPNHLKEYDIPLSARIMAVADVFDAISEKRCYRDALTLPECYAIIEKGRGTDFEPLIVDVFLASKDKVEEVYRSVS